MELEGHGMGGFELEGKRKTVKDKNIYWEMVESIKKKGKHTTDVYTLNPRPKHISDYLWI